MSSLLKLDRCAAISGTVKPIEANRFRSLLSRVQARCYHGAWELKGTRVTDDDAPSVGV
jgi:hypothetical protein